MASVWDKVGIVTGDGTAVEGIAPVIISASRATDIPAFYSEWFMHRLHAGYAVWLNPFSGTEQYVSFEKVRAVVFWSKNPQPLLPHLDTLDRRGLNYYFQFTLNDYDAEGFEPNVPALDDRVATFRKLAKRIGKQRVIWRFDPMLITSATSPDHLCSKIVRLGEKLQNNTEKLVISFADILAYRKVSKNLAHADIDGREFSAAEMHDVAGRIADAARSWGMTVATCAEPEDLSKHGVVHNKCIDDDLLARCFAHDKPLMQFLGRSSEPLQAELFSATSTAPSKRRRTLKDKGQRKACGCIVSKDIGSYNTCPHLCVYCYANAAKSSVLRNWSTHNSRVESIVCAPLGR